MTDTGTAAPESPSLGGKAAAGGKASAGGSGGGGAMSAANAIKKVRQQGVKNTGKAAVKDAAKKKALVLAAKAAGAAASGGTTVAVAAGVAKYGKFAKKIVKAGLVLIVGCLAFLLFVGAGLGGGSAVGSRIQLIRGMPFLDIPGPAAEAYVVASAQIGTEVPGCELSWAVFAGIAKVESSHGQYGGAAPDAQGNVAPEIIGIPLDGTNGTARILDTDDGSFDHDTVYDRAVGPFQFIPSSWQIFGRDGDGDDFMNPHNMFDASLAAGVHLCQGRPFSSSDTTSLESALFSYNRSDAYVSEVMSHIRYYETYDPEVSTISTGTGTIVNVRGIQIDAALAPNLERLLNDAPPELGLSGGGYRSPEDQIAVRINNCGPSYYDIWLRPSGKCSPPTARPGHSMHERGLAIDFSSNGATICFPRPSSQCSHPAFRWLQANAHNYGLQNLPSEAWHWSVNGQ